MPSSFGVMYKLGGDHLPTSTIYSLEECCNKLVVSAYHLVEQTMLGVGIWGNYHLHGKTGNSSGKIKWFVSFRLGSFRKYGL